MRKDEVGKKWIIIVGFIPSLLAAFYHIGELVR